MSGSPRVNVGDKMIPEFHKALGAFSDSPFARPFLSRQLLKYLRSPSDCAESTSTDIQYSDFCKFGCVNKKLVASKNINQVVVVGVKQKGGE